MLGGVIITLPVGADPPAAAVSVTVAVHVVVAPAATELGEQASDVVVGSSAVTTVTVVWALLPSRF